MTAVNLSPKVENVSTKQRGLTTWPEQRATQCIQTDTGSYCVSELDFINVL